MATQTNFQYLTESISRIGFLIDKFMTKPQKCCFCIRKETPSCPADINCFVNIMAWLKKSHQAGNKFIP